MDHCEERRDRHEAADLTQAREVQRDAWDIASKDCVQSAQTHTESAKRKEGKNGCTAVVTRMCRARDQVRRRKKRQIAQWSERRRLAWSKVKLGRWEDDEGSPHVKRGISLLKTRL